MKKNTIGKISYITMATMTCLSLTGCGTKAEEVMKPLKDGKYEDALSKYEDADFSDKEKDKLKKELKELLSNIVMDYAAGNITYDEAKSTIATISDMDIKKLDEDLATASGEIAILYTSKTSYENGKKYMSKGDYLAAIECFNKVIEKDINYEDANTQMENAKELHYEQSKAEVLKEVDAYISLGEYASAFTKLDAFIDENNVEDKALNDKYEEYVNAYVTAITTKVDNYIKAKDFTSAFEEVNCAKDVLDIEEFTTLYKKVEDEYVLMITEKVEGLISSKDYLLAIEILNNAQEIVASEKFTELMTQIEEEKPTYFSELKYQTCNQFELVDTGEAIIDTIGNTYTPNGNLYEMTTSMDAWSTDVSEGSVEYYLGYSYNTLCFTVAVDDISNNVSSVLNIYGDDILLQSINLDRKTAPTKVTVDISNVNYLSIKLSGFIGSYDTSLTAIISEGYLE